MDGRRGHKLTTGALAGILLAFVQAGPVAAADCQLSAPASVEIGADLSIQGSGFPASSAVDITLSIEGGGSDELVAQTNADGQFSITLTPEVADRGLTTVVATAGSGCRAEVVIGVGVPAPTTEPGESTGGAAGESDSPPRTDGLVGSTQPTGSMPLALWFLAGALIGLGLGSRYASRPSRVR